MPNLNLEEEEEEEKDERRKGQEEGIYITSFWCKHQLLLLRIFIPNAILRGHQLRFLDGLLVRFQFLIHSFYLEKIKFSILCSAPPLIAQVIFFLMVKRKSWFSRLTRMFFSESKSISEKREKRKLWFFGRVKSKSIPAIRAPSALEAKLLREAKEEHIKHAVAVAVATAAAAEAAVAAAQAAAEVIRLSEYPSYQQNQETAAIKIQSGFRGYLARVALKALKGIVMLQALIRGQAVRCQTSVALKSLQSLMKIQSHARASRSRTIKEYQTYEVRDIVYQKLNELDDVKTMLQQKSERRWDNSSLLKEDIDATLKNKREAMLKRLRALEYASLYQERRNIERPNTPNVTRRHADDLNHSWSLLEQWVGAQSMEDIQDIFTTETLDKEHYDKSFRNVLYSVECPENEEEAAQLQQLARRSFNRSRRESVKDEYENDSFSASPSFPGYMASTASTKARFRSISAPKQRVAAVAVSSADNLTNYQNRLLSPGPAICSDVSFSRGSKSPLIHQLSPRLKRSTISKILQVSRLS